MKRQGEGGRNVTPRFETQATASSAASKGQPLAAETRVLKNAFAKLRQCKELRVKLTLQSQNQHQFRHPQDEHECITLSKQSRSFIKNWDLPLQSNADPLCLNDVSVCISAIEVRIEAIKKDQKQTRVDSWKRELRADYRNGGRKVFSWIRDDWKPPITCVSAENGHVITEKTRVVDTVQNVWDKLHCSILQTTSLGKPSKTLFPSTYSPNHARLNQSLF